MSKPVVSIVVPIYNVESYLTKCVDSILQQDYTNLDIILVDDGSPDSCPQLCDQYAQADSRVRVIHKKNGGLSDARNAGLRIAKGEYIAFIDGDDYLETTFISILLNEALSTQADVCVSSYYRVYGDKLVLPPKNVSQATFTNLEAVRDLLSSPSICDVMAWNKLYKTTLFTQNGIEYPFGKVHEDMFTTYKLFYAANKVRFVNQPLYYYVQREGSIINQGFNKKRLHAVEAASQVEQWVQDNKLPLEHEVANYKFGFVIAILNAMIDQQAFDPGIWRELSSWVAQNRSALLHNPKVSASNKLLIRALALGHKPYAVLRKAIVTLKRGS